MPAFDDILDRHEIGITVSPFRNPTFVTLSNGTIRNNYEIRLRNKHGEERQFGVNVSEDLTLEGTPLQISSHRP